MRASKRERRYKQSKNLLNLKGQWQNLTNTMKMHNTKDDNITTVRWSPLMPIVSPFSLSLCLSHSFLPSPVWPQGSASSEWGHSSGMKLTFNLSTSTWSLARILSTWTTNQHRAHGACVCVHAYVCLSQNNQIILLIEKHGYILKPKYIYRQW